MAFCLLAVQINRAGRLEWGAGSPGQEAAPSSRGSAWARGQGAQDIRTQAGARTAWDVPGRSGGGGSQPGLPCRDSGPRARPAGVHPPLGASGLARLGADRTLLLALHPTLQNCLPGTAP